MNISESEVAFEQYASAKAIDVHSPDSVIELAKTWLAFFEEVRAMDTIEHDGLWPDALLFEFGYRQALTGYYGACFYLNLTRQFVSREGEDDDAMFQLRWIAEYEPTELLVALGYCAEWCDSLQALSSFSEFVLSSPALSTVDMITPYKISYHLTGL